MMSLFILENKIRELNNQDVRLRISENPWRQLVTFSMDIPNDDIARQLFKTIKERFKYVENAMIVIRKTMNQKRAIILFTESKYHILPYSEPDIENLSKYGDWVKFMGDPINIPSPPDNRLPQTHSALY